MILVYNLEITLNSFEVESKLHRLSKETLNNEIH
jgi:hypothetical protein